MTVWFIFSFVFIMVASIIMLGPAGKGRQHVRFFGWFWLSVALLMAVMVYVFAYMVDWNAPVY
jgi:hypothetical protein